MIGKKLSPILEEIEMTLLEFNANDSAGKPEFTDEGFRASIYIFMTVFMEKIYDLQDDENIDMGDRMKMVESAGTELRKLIKTYTNIDTHDFLKQ